MAGQNVLVARTGRKYQRYDNGVRLVAGCIPYRVKSATVVLPGPGKMKVEPDMIEVLMISSQRGEGLLFPKGGWETDETAEEAAVREAMEEAGVRGKVEGLVGQYDFKSKRTRSEVCQHGDCRCFVYLLAVTEMMEVWPEQDTRRREWMSLGSALEQCRHDWMGEALRQWRDVMTTDKLPVEESFLGRAGQPLCL